MSNICYETGCDKTNTDYVDASCGPVGDFRYYCPKHLIQFQARDKIRSVQSTIVYLISEIEHCNIKTTEHISKLKEKQEELRELIR